MTLSPEELDSRRRGDAADLLEIHRGPYPVTIRGFHSPADARANVREVPLDDVADPPTTFTVRCDFASLDEHKRPLRGVTFLVDPNANGDYPVTEPVAHVISRPVPFAPHIGLPSGSVCHGHEVWVPLRSPLWIFVAQLCRLANYDEPVNEHVTVMNQEAMRHWVSIGRRPLNPELGSPSASGRDHPTKVLRRSVPASDAARRRTLRRASPDPLRTRTLRRAER